MAKSASGCTARSLGLEPYELGEYDSSGCSRVGVAAGKAPAREVW